MNEDTPIPEVTLSDIRQSLEDMKGLIDVGNVASGQLHNDLVHLSGKLDILNHSLYVQNQFLVWSTLSVMLIAALLIFVVGYMISRR